MATRLEDPRRIAEIAANRSCGECTLCCKVMPIYDEACPSEGGEWCQHCDVGVGCQIYETRPAECRGYECLWLQGMLPESCRPDKSGAVFSLRGDGALDDMGNPFPLFVVHPQTEYQLKPMAEKLIIEILRQMLPVIVIGRATGCWAFLEKKEGKWRVGMTERRGIVDGKLDSFEDHPIAHLKWRNLFDIMGVPEHSRKRFFQDKDLNNVRSEDR